MKFIKSKFDNQIEPDYSKVNLYDDYDAIDDEEYDFY